MTLTRRSLILPALLAGILAILAITAIPATSAVAAETLTPEALERGLVGSWSGALAYRDDQSNARVALPVQTRVDLGADGATFTRVSRWGDGPKTGTVTITTVSLFDTTGASVTHAMVRKGRAVETWTETVSVQAHNGPEDWTLVDQRRGTDGNQPADIRITQTRRGGDLKAVKEGKAPDQPDSADALRNETVLQRVP